MSVPKETTTLSKIGDFVCSAAALTFVLSAVWWIIDFNFAATFLATPVNPVVLQIALALGAVAGACVVVSDHLRRFRRRKVAMYETRSAIFIVIIMGIAFALFGAILADAVVRRVANVYLFWSSNAPVVREFFPIRKVLPRKATQAVSVGLQGEGRRLEISRKDYDMLGGSGNLDRPWIYCLSLLEQREGEAIRVWLPPRLTAGFDGITIVRCPDDVQMVD
ncbi:hypothetical protein [Shinella sp.]|uniref:hypothetical protein n=1 Tax=Shinella sp. TaxID=1870904 RepID=UPI0029AA7D8B|nr:hypothetical protein [Shinella sp.]MDX3977317.1 hypothetical protein [Shinella sp.]